MTWLVGALSPITKVFGFNPQLGHVWEATSWCFSLTLMFLSLSNQWTYPQVKIKKNISRYISSNGCRTSQDKRKGFLPWQVWLSWLEHRPITKGLWFNPQSRHIPEATNWCFSLALMCLSLPSPTLSFSLSKNKPPYRPDLAPCNFWLFPKVKSLLKGKRFQTINEIQENMTGQLMVIGRTVWVPRGLLWRGLSHLGGLMFHQKTLHETWCMSGCVVVMTLPNTRCP